MRHAQSLLLLALVSHVLTNERVSQPCSLQTSTPHYYAIVDDLTMPYDDIFCQNYSKMLHDNDGRSVLYEGHLATISTEDELMFVTNFLAQTAFRSKHTHFWISGRWNTDAGLYMHECGSCAEQGNALLDDDSQSNHTFWRSFSPLWGTESSVVIAFDTAGSAKLGDQVHAESGLRAKSKTESLPFVIEYEAVDTGNGDAANLELLQALTPLPTYDGLCMPFEQFADIQELFIEGDTIDNKSGDGCLGTYYGDVCGAYIFCESVANHRNANFTCVGGVGQWEVATPKCFEDTCVASCGIRHVQRSCQCDALCVSRGDCCDDHDMCVTAMPTPLPSPLPTSAPTPTPTSSPTSTPTLSPTPMPTSSPTLMPTSAPTPTPTSSPTSMPTPSPTPMPTSSPTLMPTSAPTPTPTSSPTSMPTPSPTPMPTSSPTPTSTSAPTPMPTPSPTPRSTSSPTPTSTSSPTPTSTSPPTSVSISSPTPIPTSRLTSPTKAPAPMATSSPTPAPTTDVEDVDANSFTDTSNSIDSNLIIIIAVGSTLGGTLAMLLLVLWCFKMRWKRETDALHHVARESFSYSHKGSSKSNISASKGGDNNSTHYSVGFANNTAQFHGSNNNRSSSSLASSSSGGRGRGHVIPSHQLSHAKHIRLNGYRQNNAPSEKDSGSREKQFPIAPSINWRVRPCENDHYQNSASSDDGGSREKHLREKQLPITPSINWRVRPSDKNDHYQDNASSRGDDGSREKQLPIAPSINWRVRSSDKNDIKSNSSDKQYALLPQASSSTSSSSSSSSILKVAETPPSLSPIPDVTEIPLSSASSSSGVTVLTMQTMQTILSSPMTSGNSSDGSHHLRSLSPMRGAGGNSDGSGGNKSSLQQQQHRARRSPSGSRSSHRSRGKSPSHFQATSSKSSARSSPRHGSSPRRSQAHQSRGGDGSGRPHSGVHRSRSHLEKHSSPPTHQKGGGGSLPYSSSRQAHAPHNDRVQKNSGRHLRSASSHVAGFQTRIEPVRARPPVVRVNSAIAPRFQQHQASAHSSVSASSFAQSSGHPASSSRTPSKHSPRREFSVHVEDEISPLALDHHPTPPPPPVPTPPSTGARTGVEEPKKLSALLFADAESERKHLRRAVSSRTVIERVDRSPSPDRSGIRPSSSSHHHQQHQQRQRHVGGIRADPQEQRLKLNRKDSARLHSNQFVIPEDRAATAAAEEEEALDVSPHRFAPISPSTFAGITSMSKPVLAKNRQDMFKVTRSQSGRSKRYPHTSEERAKQIRSQSSQFVGSRATSRPFKFK